MLHQSRGFWTALKLLFISCMLRAGIQQPVVLSEYLRPATRTGTKTVEQDNNSSDSP